MHISNCVVSEPKFTGPFSPNARGIVVDTLVFFWILDMLNRCEDIGDQSRKLYETAPFLHVLDPIFGKGPRIFRLVL